MTDKYSDRYYIGKWYAGQQVLLRVDAPARQFEVWQSDHCLKRCPIRNLFHGELPLADYVDLMVKAAQSEEKRLKSEIKLLQLKILDKRNSINLMQETKSSLA